MFEVSQYFPTQLVGICYHCERVECTVKFPSVADALAYARKYFEQYHHLKPSTVVELIDERRQADRSKRSEISRRRI